MTKKELFQNLGAFVLCAAIAAGCGKDPKNDPEPDPAKAPALQTITITAPTVSEANRTITDKAGEYGYADKADAVVKMTFTNADPATKDSAIVINLSSKVTWLTAPVKLAIEGEMPALAPALSGTDKITVKYGALEATDFFTVANTQFSVTRSGKTADMPAFGFTKVEAVGNAANEVTYATESGKDYEVNTLTQKFKLTHSDGTEKEIEVAVLEARRDITGIESTLVSVVEKSCTPSVNAFGNAVIDLTYVVTRKYSYGADKDTSFVIMTLHQPVKSNIVNLAFKDENFKFQKVELYLDGFERPYTVSEDNQKNITAIATHYAFDFYFDNVVGVSYYIVVPEFTYFEGDVSTKLSYPEISTKYISDTRSDGILTVTYESIFGGLSRELSSSTPYVIEP